VADDSTEFQIDFGVAGAAGLDSAANSLEELEKRLTMATSAASQAVDAVKTSEASYNSAEKTYDRASKALEKINLAMQDASGKQLEKLQARQTDAAAAAEKARVAMVGEAAALDKLNASASAATKTQDALKKKIDAEKKAADAATKASEAGKATGNLRKLSKGLRELGGPLGEEGAGIAKFAHAFEGLEGALGGGGAVLAALPILVVALTTAVLGATAAFAVWAIKGADAARSQELLTEGMVQSAKGGKQLEDQISSLSERVPQTSEELHKMAGELAKSGLRGKALGDALETAAEKAAKAKYGPDWQKQNISLEKSTAKLHGVLDRLFAKLNVEKVLQGIADIVGLFDKGTASSKALETVWGDLVQGLVNGVADFLPKVRTAFIQFEILVLKALIAIKPFGSTILFVAEAVGVTAAAIVGLLVGAIVIVTGLIVGAIAVLYKLVTALSDAGVAIGQWFKTLGDVSLLEIGTNMIQGLVDGIIGAGPKVLESLKGIVNGAISGAEKLLKIGSPSKVFAEIGANTALGMAQGIDSGTGAVQDSVESMVAPPSAPAPAEASATGGGNTFNITINAGSGEATDIADAVKQVLLEVLEGDATQLGSAEAFA
jgi:hypothetical protein